MTLVQDLEPNNDKTEYKDYEITFPRPVGILPDEYDKILIFTTIELQSTDYPNRYIVNTANITHKGFTARVTRLDGKGWEMKLQLNYWVTTRTVFN